MDSDRDLVRAARGGDRSAFKQLIDRHYPSLLAACRRSLGQVDGAADAAQEAVVIAMVGLSRLREEDRFGAWLAGIGRNLCRSQQRPRPSLDGILGGRHLDQDPGDIVIAADDARRVRRAVRGLPPGQRHAVGLFYLADLSHAQVAARLGTGTGAVKTRLHKARSALRRALSDPDRKASPMPTEIALKVSDVRRTPGPPPRHAIVLEGGGHRLPIWIGEADATALAATLDGVDLPRPGTHHLTAALLSATGRELVSVRIDRLLDSVFYSQLVLDDGTAVDARPSDAVHLALLSNAPVTVAREVLDAVADPNPRVAELSADLDVSTEGARVLADEMRAAMAEREREVRRLEA
jgi:RNA polymerase sigma factor (sigma-70 family)